VTSLKQRFESDVKQVAIDYLWLNRDYVLKEMKDLGLEVGVVPVSSPTAEQASAMEDRQRAAEMAADLMNARRGLRALLVGHDVDRPMDYGGMTYAGGTMVAHFDPDHKPDYPPNPDDKMASWEIVKVVDNKLVAALSALTARYPAIFALATESPGAAETAATATPEQARAIVANSLTGLFARIEQTVPKIMSDDLDYRDLTPIHAQLFSGKPSPSGVKWDESFAKWAAKDVLSDYEAKAFWISLGLTTLAAAAFIVAELATAGTATFFIAAGVAVAASATQAGISWERYLDLAGAADTSITPETSIVSHGQVDQALFTAIMDTAFALMDAYGVVSKALSRGARLATALGKESMAALRPQLVALGLEEAAIGRVLAKNTVDHIKGQLLEELLAIRAARMLGEEGGRVALAGSRAAEKLELIAGHRITDALGRQFSDGIIAIRQGNTIEIVVLFESKAGKAAKAGLRGSYTGVASMSEAELKEVRAAAIDALREERPALRKMSMAEIEKQFAADIDRMIDEEFSLAESGQVRRDIERISPNAGEASTTLLIDGVPTEVVSRPSTTKVVGVLPADVKAGRMAKLFGKEGLNFEALNLGIAEKDLQTLAEAIDKAVAATKAAK
jgi:hypothetical protein